MQINLTNIFTNNLEFVKIEKTLLINNVKLANETAIIQDGIFIRLVLEKIASNEFILNGLIKAKLVLDCSRCNEPAEYNLESNFFRELNIGVVEDDEEIFVEGYNLDLEKLALNEIYLNFPMKVLCKEDCKGICKNCGTNLNLHKCNCENDNIDPRLAGLKALFDENFKEV